MPTYIHEEHYIRLGFLQYTCLSGLRTELGWISLQRRQKPQAAIIHACEGFEACFSGIMECLKVQANEGLTVDTTSRQHSEAQTVCIYKHYMDNSGVQLKIKSTIYVIASTP